MKAKYTPGPWYVNKHFSEWLIGDGDGNYLIAKTAGSPAYLGRASAERDAANARLIAAAPDLLKALQDLIDSHWLHDSHAVEFDGTVMFGPYYDFSGIDGYLRSEFRDDGIEFVVWPAGGAGRKWSAYSTHEGLMWFEKFESEAEARAVCMKLLSGVMPEHPVSKAMSAIAKAIGESQ